MAIPLLLSVQSAQAHVDRVGDPAEMQGEDADECVQTLLKFVEYAWWLEGSLLRL